MLPRRAEINIYLLNAENIFPGISYTPRFISSTNAWWPLYSSVLNFKQRVAASHCLECVEVPPSVAFQKQYERGYNSYCLEGHFSLTPCTASKKSKGAH